MLSVLVWFFEFVHVFCILIPCGLRCNAERAGLIAIFLYFFFICVLFASTAFKANAQLVALRVLVTIILVFFHRWLLFTCRIWLAHSWFWYVFTFFLIWSWIDSLCTQIIAQQIRVVGRRDRKLDFLILVRFDFVCSECRPLYVWIYNFFHFFFG